MKRKNVTHGYFVRNTDSELQTLEVVNRFQLVSEIKEFTRCIECNSILEPVEKNKIIDRLPPRVKENYNEFFICTNCSKIYWHGSHVKDMLNLVKKLRRT